MLRGIDTTFLVEVDVTNHTKHQQARMLMDRLLEAGESFALAPQVLAEFIHVMTDGKRFQHPLSPQRAMERAQLWWNAKEVVQVFPNNAATQLFLKWMGQHRLGRKRILDTQLAATYYQAGIRSILSANARDYRIFACFEVLST